MELPDMITPRLNTGTALGQALISMFKSVEAELTSENAAPGVLKIIIWWVRSAPLYEPSCLHGR